VYRIYRVFMQISVWNNGGGVRFHRNRLISHRGQLGRFSANFRRTFTAAAVNGNEWFLRPSACNIVIILLMTGNILSRRRLGRAPKECTTHRRRQYIGNYTHIVTISTYFLCSGAWYSRQPIYRVVHQSCTPPLCEVT